MHGISPAATHVADSDCYYYYYSSCAKGNSCEFRHEPSALGKEIVCPHWVKGNCRLPRCPLRHMKITKNRDEIPCYHETQPGGCTKPHCPFLHGASGRGIPSNRGGTTGPLSRGGTRGHLTRGCARGRGRGGNSPQHYKGANVIGSSNNPQFNDFRGVPANNRNISSKLTSDARGKKNKGQSRQAVSLSNLSLSDDVEPLSPYSVVSCLVKCRNFSSPSRILSMTLKYKESQVKQIVNICTDVFSVRKDLVSLRPKIIMCHNYTTEKGCSEGIDCLNLHLCPLYVVSHCNDSNCFLGHVLKTNHNKKIYEQFYIDRLSISELHNLFRTMGSSIWATKENVKICEDYNEGNCLNDKCSLLHFCLAFLAKKCSDKCKLNHNFLKGNIRTVLKSHGLSVNESPKDIMETIAAGSLVQDQIKATLLSDASDIVEKTLPSESDASLLSSSDSISKPLTMWTHHLCGETIQSEICFDSVEGYCQFEHSGCPKLHATQHFHWQAKEKGQPWINLRQEQVFALEKAYCDPDIDEVELPPLDPAKLDDSLKNLLSMMQGRKKWKANFDKMELTILGTSSNPLAIRRLYTKKITSGVTPGPCLFSWYFLDKSKLWIEYGYTDSTGNSTLKCSISSDDIEKHYLLNSASPLNVKSLSYSYVLDLQNMTQTNSSTKVQRRIKRRPRPHLNLVSKDTSEQFPPLWEKMQTQDRVKRVLLNPNTAEYRQIYSYYTNQKGPSSVLKIERVQNLFLWRTFQNKIKELELTYNNKDSVNVQQLFHGTRADVVDNICKENFDWRLHGCNAGQAYGRGTYFSPRASTSYRYTSSDTSGFRYMFIAKVAVGTVTQGNSSMVRPPHNPSTNCLYDSTADCVPNPSIIVKYDKQEYYPEYLLTLS